jgi:hypothetical protein
MYPPYQPNQAQTSPLSKERNVLFVDWHPFGINPRLFDHATQDESLFPAKCVAWIAPITLPPADLKVLLDLTHTTPHESRYPSSVPSEIYPQGNSSGKNPPRLID